MPHLEKRRDVVPTQAHVTPQSEAPAEATFTEQMLSSQLLMGWPLWGLAPFSTSWPHRLHLTLLMETLKQFHRAENHRLSGAEGDPGYTLSGATPESHLLVCFLCLTTVIKTGHN